MLILLAFYVTLGRQLAPILEGQTERLEKELSSLVGADVIIGRLTGEWQKFSPTIILQDLVIPYSSNSAPNQINSHIINDLKIEFNIPASLSQRALVIRGLNLNNVRIELVEDESGHWGLSGFNGGSGGFNERIVNFLLNTAKLELTETQLLLQRFDGSFIEFNNIYVQLVNINEQHQLQVQFRLYDRGEPIRLQVELIGDPRISLDGAGYVKVNQIDFTQLLSSILPNKLDLLEVSGKAELWFEFENNLISEIHASVNEAMIRSDMPDNSQGVDLSSGHLDFTALQNDKGNWQLWFEDIDFDWHNQPWSMAGYFAELDLREEGKQLLDISTVMLDLEIIGAFLEEITLPELGREVLNDLKPSGQLTNVHFATDLLGKYPGTFDLTANLKDIAIGAWQGAPSAQGVNGYVKANLSGGFVELDSTNFDIHLPLVFDQGWHYDSINSRVHWSISEELIRINSSIVDAHNGELSGRVQFELNNTRTLQGAWETDLTLFIGILAFDVGQKTQYLPKLPNIESTMNWLDQSLQSGDITASGFVFRGVTSGEILAGSSTMQTFYNVSNARLEFLPDWPMLEELKAFVSVDNEDVDIIIEDAEIAGINVNRSSATVRQKNADGPWLAINAYAQTGAAQGLDFLRNTPIRDSLGDYIDNWSATGNVAVEVNLGIPIISGTLEETIDVSVFSENSVLNIPDFDLNITDVQGVVAYNNISGLNAQALSAKMFAGPVTVDIENYTDPVLRNSGLVIKSSGRVTSSALQQFSGLAPFVKDVLAFTDGETEYTAELRISDSETQNEVLSSLTIQSELLGLTVSLPAPFNKRFEVARKLNLNFDFMAESEIITGSYGEEFYSQLKLTDESVDWGGLFFGRFDQSFESRQINTAEPGLAINGVLEYFDYDAWERVSQSFTNDDSESGLDEIIRIVDVNISQLTVLDQELFDIHTTVQRSSYSSWRVDLENDVVLGYLDIPDDLEVPYEVHLDYLYLPEEDDEGGLESESEPEFDIFAEVDPNELPNMNFTLDHFSIGDRDLGEWQFTLHGNSLGTSIRDFIISMDDAHITGLAGESGAEIEWLYRDGRHTSHFSGSILIDNLAQVLPKWGYGANLESESATFIADLGWQASPAGFSLLNASGTLGVNILDGRFVNIDSGGARIFGALNFDSIVRRLQLDFSDLYETGLAFDDINGQLIITEGNVVTDGVFVIDGPSSIINVDGEIDLVNQTVNTDLLVSIPISQNIAVVAGILGAWPVAVGTYVVGKIFRDEFAGLTAVRYRLDGAWDELNAGFESADDDEIIEASNE